MDYREEPSSEKLPFYMTYPMQNLYLTEMEYEKDMERMKELYPREVNRILLCIDERCDELEFEGSRIFDENPDRIMMEREVQRIYQKIRENELNTPQNEMPRDNTANPRMVANETKGKKFPLFPPEGFEVPKKKEIENEAESLMIQSRQGCDDWLCSLIGVLFSDEVYRRRCRHRRCRRWW